MRRRAGKTLTMLSAVICIGSLLLVGRSFWRADGLTIPLPNDTALMVQTTTTRVHIWHFTRPSQFKHYSTPAPSPYVQRYEQRDEDELWEHAIGVRWLGVGYHSPVPRKWYRGIVLPLWLVPIVTAIAPVRWWMRRRRDGRRAFEVERVADSARSTSN